MKDIMNVKVNMMKLPITQQVIELFGEVLKDEAIPESVRYSYFLKLNAITKENEKKDV